MQYVNIVVGFFSLIMEFILLMITNFDRRKNTGLIKTLRALFMTTVVLLVLSIALEFLRGLKDFDSLILGIITLLFISSFVTGFLVISYVCEILTQYPVKNYKRFCMVWTVIAACVVLINCVTGLLFNVDAGGIQLHEYWIVPYLLSLPYFIAGISMMIKFKSKMEREDFSSLLGYSGICFLGAAFQCVPEHVNTFYPAMVISHVLIYCFFSIKYSQEAHERGNLLKIQDILLECLSELSDGANFDKSVSNLMRILAQYHRSEEAYICYIDQNDRTNRHVFGWQVKPKQNGYDFCNSVDESEFSHWMTLLSEQGFISWNRHDRDQNIGKEAIKILKSINDETTMVAPVMHNGEVFGFISLHNPKEHLDVPILMQSVSGFISEEIQNKAYSDRLYELSYTDMMTGLKNRHAYIQAIRELGDGKKNNIGVIFADINGLKAVNDMHGHEQGDILIKRSTGIMRQFFKEKSDTIYRIGGDEFVIICDGIEEACFTERVNELLKTLENQPLFSIGETWIEKCASIESQIRAADVKMYERKSEYYRRQGFDRRKRRDDTGKSNNE